MAYLLDADVFIRAKNLHYGFDFCPAFWDWLIQQNNESNIYSIEKVFDELLAVEDELAEWSGDRGDRFFLDERLQKRMPGCPLAVTTDDARIKLRKLYPD